MFRFILAALLLVTNAAIAGECAQDSLAIRGDGLSAHFTAEVALTPEEKARGLMFRETMAPFHGMLFVYEHPQRVSFWMRNTLISLDMVFVDATGTVRNVHPNATPQSDTAIPGGSDDIQFVFEINGGLAAMLGLTAGAEIQHPAIDQNLAAWPCDSASE